MVDPLTLTSVVATIASPFLQVFLDRLTAFVSGKVKGTETDQEKLKNLKRALMRILAMIDDDMEYKGINHKAWEAWLRDLKTAVFEAEDILDEIEIDISQENLKQSDQSHGDQVRDSSSKITLPDSINKVQKKLEDIANEMRDFYLKRLVRGTQLDMRERPQTSSFMGECYVIGRDDDKMKIVDLLVSNESNEENVTVISLVGMGGVGKTTLAQIVYNDERVLEKFQLRMWVSVTKDFNVRNLTKSIIESASTHIRNESGTEYVVDRIDLDPLQVKLQRLVRDQRFLLVLDDVWNVSNKDWDDLKAPLRVGAQGSKILVTTQSKIVSSTMDSNAIPLNCLSEDDCWSLLERRAFPAGKPYACSNLEAIGKEIARKCKGLPLAAKTLGSLLKSMTDEHEWDAILKSEIWELPEENNEIFPALWFSYQYLPPHLKQCFAYCSIFPKGHKFDKETLVQLWMAQGFIQLNGRRRMEDIGGHYFDNLFWRSLFELQEPESNNQPRYQMHYLIHDLAQYVSHDECFRMEDGNNTYKPYMSANFRHSSWLCRNDPQVTFDAVNKCGSLRTIRQQCIHREHHIHEVNYKQLTKVTHLRVLDLRGSRITSLPVAIGSLKHLRYLDLSETPIEKLPKTVCKLYCLQTLKLEECKNLRELQHINMEKQTGLRHLYLDGKSGLNSMPMKIGKLTSLQTLWPFIVGKEKGQRIGEIKGMNNLQALCISRLEDEANVQEAALDDKRNLHKLMLQWDGTGVANADVQADHLRDLRPPQNLKELYLNNYVGQSYPDWMTTNSFSNLVNVSLCKCQILPPLWRLPSLKSLSIAQMDGVTYIDGDFYGNGSRGGFPLLDTLEFLQMPNLLGWDQVGEHDMRCLRQLTINCCPLLHTLPVLEQLNSLHCLKIDIYSFLSQWMTGHLDWEMQTQLERMVIYNRR